MIKLLKLVTLGLGCAGSIALGADAAPGLSGPVVPLQDLLVAALNTNIELQAKRIDPQIQGFRIDGAKGAFDPAFAMGAFSSITNQPQNQRDFLATGSQTSSDPDRLYQDQSIRYEAGFTGKIQTGLTYTLSSSVERSDNTFNRPNSSNILTLRFHPEYTTKATLAITQPLLRDFGFSANLAEVRLAKNGLNVSRYELSATVIKVIATVLNAYYEMAFGQENLLVKQQAVSLAENLVQQTERRVQEGKMGRLDTIQARVRLSEAREEYLLAKNFLSQRRNTLRELTRDKFDLDEPDWLIDGSFLRHTPPKIDRNRLLALLFETNPAYLAGVEQARAEDIRIAYAKNQRWPRVDLKASLSENGLNNYWGTAYSNMRNRREPDWSAGVIVNVPLTGRTEKARLAEARSRKVQALLSMKRNELLLLSAFDTAMHDIVSAQDRIALVHESVQLAVSALDAEEKRLATGMTTSYNVGVVQKDLSTARSREQATFVDLNKAVTQLYALVGILPEEMKTEIKY
jgi:outer membrane protein TolC